MPANWDATRISAVLRTTNQVIPGEMLPISTGRLRFSRRRVTCPALLLRASLCNKISYNKGRVGGGNCTRSPFDATSDGSSGYEMRPGGWPEHGREDEALRELAANWRRLAPSVREKIMELVRTSQE
jgi:hypothetical protein